MAKQSNLRGTNRLLLNNGDEHDDLLVHNNKMQPISNDGDKSHSQPFQWKPALSNDVNRGAHRSEFSITLMNMGSGGRRYENIFQRAARKWEKIIIGDLPNERKVRNTSSHSWFGDVWEEKVNVDIDDVLIGWSMEDIDGYGSTLGYAGKKFFENNNPSLFFACSTNLIHFFH